VKTIIAFHDRPPGWSDVDDLEYSIICSGNGVPAGVATKPRKSQHTGKDDQKEKEKDEEDTAKLFSRAEAESKILRVEISGKG
jgi:hypothetical protein